MDQQSKIKHDSEFANVSPSTAAQQQADGKADWVLLSGGSGMLGSAIRSALRAKGYRVLRLVRRVANPTLSPAPEKSSKLPEEIYWDLEAPVWDASPLKDYGRLAGAIHLSGANLADKPWSDAYKRLIASSRLHSTQMLSEGLAKLPYPPRALLCASATGIYGDRGGDQLDENSAAGEGFLPELCRAWEGSANAAKDAGIRVAHLRFGMVIGAHGGAMAKLLPLFRSGFGGRMGNGRQWMSWITETDAAAAALFALENPRLSGPLNLTSPNPVTNREFTRELGLAVHRPAILPAPVFALRIALGQMADDALLASVRAVPKRLLTAGFAFTHPTIAEAFQAVLAAEKK